LDDEARVTGARVSNSEGETYVDADNVLLATGGFQGDPALRVRYIHPAADRLLLRANPCSAGDGLRLALDIGASHSDNMSSFYGCLMPYPLTRELSQTDYTALAQYHSEHAVLINRAGRRFCDESLGDRVSAGAVLRQPGATALLLADEELKSRYILQAFIPGMDRGMDKFELARTLGAHLVSAPTLPELAYQVGQWGFNAERLLMTISRYNDDLINGTPGHPRRSRHAMRLTTPPFFALEVQPAITMTYGGVRVDGHCRALTREGAVIKGLYAIGFDAGGFYQRGYAGGLARALVTGAIAVEHILSLPREVTHA
jgi:succinate dehydrogenase/fumarate reductase flavoprotein subunit